MVEASSRMVVYSTRPSNNKEPSHPRTTRELGLASFYYGRTQPDFATGLASAQNNWSIHGSAIRI